jgi:RNA polymerase sigma-70 factor (ECF subfamily)
MSTSDRDDWPVRLARGDESAFAELYDACADRLHHYLAVRLGCRDAAADALQSAFLRAVRSRRRFRDVQNPVAYMFQIARNEAARSRRPRESKQLGVEDVFEMPSDVIGQHDDAEMAAVALARLAGDDREVVELKIYGGLTFRDIADVTGMPQGTVATKYRRALESLRHWLTKQLR